MLANLSSYIFFGIPIAAVLFFAVSLYRYSYAKFKNKRQPDTFGAKELKNRLVLLIVSSVIAGILAAVVIGFTSLLLMAVAFM